MHVVAFIVAMAVFVFGLWLFGFAFAVTAVQLPILFAGILAVAVALWSPTRVLRD